MGTVTIQELQKAMDEELDEGCLIVTGLEKCEKKDEKWM